MFSGLFFRLTNLRCFFQSLVLFCSLRTAKPWAPRYHKWSTKLIFLASQVSCCCILSLKMSLSNKKDLSLERFRTDPLTLFCCVPYCQKLFPRIFRRLLQQIPCFSMFSPAFPGARGAASAAAVVGGLCARRAAGGRLPWCRGAVACGTSVVGKIAAQKQGESLYITIHNYGNA